jgi:hypothetical protein
MTRFSKRSLEGEMMIDHRESPGLRPEDVAHIPGAIAVGKGQLFESAIISCSHCPRIVVLNPDRSRERGYCRKCDDYICDFCTEELHRTGVCRTWVQVIDEILEA